MTPKTLAALTAWALVGALTWTLLEYIIHKYAGHRGKGKNPFGKEHLKHHATTHYFAPNWKKAMAAAPVIFGAWALFAWALGPMAGTAYALGLSGMYIGYEIAHRRAHTHPPTGRYGRWMRLHHFYHHFRNPNVNHGVTSPFWDMVFGTYVKVERVRVPEKHAMRWLVDPATGEVWPRYANDYELARRSSKHGTNSNASADADELADEPPAAIATA